MKTRLVYRILGLVFVGAIVLSSTAHAVVDRDAQGVASSIRIEGRISSLSPTEWMVGTFTVLVGPKTTLVEKRARAELDAWVIVWATRSEAGQLLADLIYVNRPPDRSPAPPEPVAQFNGVLEKQLVDSWVIGSTAFQLRPDTVITGSPQRLDLVWVAAESVDNQLQAIAIEKVVGRTEEVPVEFEGVIRSISQDLVQVEDVWVRVPPGTTVIDGPLAVGQYVEVRATPAQSGPGTARFIRVQEAVEVVLGAMVTTIATQAGTQVWEMVVFPDRPWSDPIYTTVNVGSDTMVDESRAVAGAGQWAEVHALPAEQNQYQAGAIRLERPVPVILQGQLSAAAATASGGNWWRINDRPVWVPGTIAVAQEARVEGSKVIVEGLLLGNGVIWATKVR